MILRKLAGVALVLSLLVGATVAGAQVEPRVITVPENDPAMEAAISQGRAALSRFWQALEKHRPDEDSFALKVALPTKSGGEEHIWAGQIERKDGKIYGTIDNVPRDLKDIRLGQRIEIPEPLISDWMYRRSGK